MSFIASRMASYRRALGIGQSRSRSRTCQHRNRNQPPAAVEVLEIRQLLSATTTPTQRLNTPEKIELHAAVHTALDAGTADVIFVGDSITQRWADEGAGAFDQYFGTHDTINMGIGGDATQSALWRLADYDLTQISPKVAVLNIGTNNICWPSGGTCTGGDTPADTAAGVLANVEYLRQALPDTRILLLGMLPRGESASDVHRLAIAETNNLIEAFDDDQYVHYLDIGDAFVQADGQISANTMFDYLHLTESGYITYAASISPYIESLMNGYSSRVVFEGTSGNDTFQFFAGEAGGYRVRLNGVDYDYTSDRINVEFHGNGGSDVVRFVGNGGDDHVTFGQQSVQLAGSGYFVSATDVRYKTVLGGGGTDIASLLDSDGDNLFVAKSTLSYITGDGIYSAAVGFKQVSAFSTQGFDLAQLYDSAGDDILTNRADDVTLENAGGTFHNSARDFEYVRTFATAGGYDQAQFYDSVGDDYFISRPGEAYMRDLGRTYWNYARGFEAYRAFSFAGGTDEAQFYDSANDDEFVAKSTFAYMRNLSGADHYSFASGFARQRGYSNSGGRDVAQFYGSGGSDQLRVTRSNVTHTGDSFENYGQGFSVVVAVASDDGYDELFQQGRLPYSLVKYGIWDKIHSIV